MEASPGVAVVCWIAGWLCIALALADVFLLVLYARMGTSLVAGRVASAAWRVFRAVGTIGGKRRDRLMSYGGPIILVLLVAVWSCLLTLGSGLVIYPTLGGGVRDTTGPTSRDFLTAMYAGGISMSIIGSSNYAPQNTLMRAVFLFNAATGVSVVSLTLTYLMQVYNALQRRNTLALRLDLHTDQTGDAAELLAAAGPSGRFESGYTNLSALAAGVSAFHESHHFYPLLVYFRGREARYSVPRMCVVCLDAATLIETALDARELAWLKSSAAVRELRLATRRMLEQLEETFLPRGTPDPERPDPQSREQWRRRYFSGVQRLRDAGIRVADTGADEYIRRRAEWDRDTAALARFMAWDIAEVDPACAHSGRARTAAGPPVRIAG